MDPDPHWLGTSSSPPSPEDLTQCCASAAICFLELIPDPLSQLMLLRERAVLCPVWALSLFQTMKSYPPQGNFLAVALPPQHPQL